MAERLGDKLKRLRQVRGWSQRELARRAQVPQAVLSALETGKRSDTTGVFLHRLAASLETSVDFLLGRMDTEDVPSRGPQRAATRPRFDTGAIV